MGQPRLKPDKTFQIRTVDDLHSVQIYLKKSFQGNLGTQYYEIQYVVQELIQNMLDENEKGSIKITRAGNVELHINLSGLPSDEKDKIWRKLMEALEKCKTQAAQPDGSFSTKSGQGRGLALVNMFRSGWNIIPSMDNSKIMLRAMYA